MRSASLLLALVTASCAYDPLGVDAQDASEESVDAGTTPEDAGHDAGSCEPRSDDELCREHGRECGPLTVVECGAEHVVDSCGTCESGTCRVDSTTPGVCGFDPAEWNESTFEDVSGVVSRQHQLTLHEVASGIIQTNVVLATATTLHWAKQVPPNPWELGTPLDIRNRAAVEGSWALKHSIGLPFDHVVYLAGGVAYDLAVESAVEAAIYDRTPTTVTSVRFAVDAANVRHVSLVARKSATEYAVAHGTASNIVVSASGWNWVEAALPATADPVELAVDTANQPHVVVNAGGIRYGRPTTTRFDLEPLDVADAVAPQLAVGLDRRVYIGWTSAAGGWFTTRSAGGTWGVPESLPPEALGGLDLAVDANGVLHAVFEDADGALWYARRSPLGWVKAKVPNGFPDAALAVEPNGRARIVGVRAGKLVQLVHAD